MADRDEAAWGADPAREVLGDADPPVGRAPRRPLSRGAVARTSVAVLVAAAVAGGGYLLGASSQQPQAAAFSALDEGLAVALGVPVVEVRDDRAYRRHEWEGCRSGTCRQVTIGPVRPPGTVMLARLQDAGWVLDSHDQPECVSDDPGVRGWVCSYVRDEVMVSVQVESPETPDELHVWASTG